jgi:hypothetical protein
MPTLLEALVADLNKNVFYREFSYSKNVFVQPGTEAEKEFADHVVWIGELLIIYQLKERDDESVQSEDGERKWFKNKVLRAATEQVRATLQYLKKHPAIDITNERGHVLNVSSAKVKQLVKLIIYKPSSLLPKDCLAIKCHVRPEPVGLTHIVTWDDYQGICSTLVTPAEVAEYFDFRERLLRKYPESDLPSERALVGQFLKGDLDEAPDEKNAALVSNLITDLDAFDISFLLHGAAERIEYQEGGSGSEVDYYGIIAEFAKLTRLELREVKTRFRLSLEAANENSFRRPMRMIAPKSGCGFAFIPIENELIDGRMVGLKNLTQIAKYDSKLDRQVGVSVGKDGSDYLIDWCLFDYPWQEDPALEKAVAEQNPFGELRSEVLPRYHILD